MAAHKNISYKIQGVPFTCRYGHQLSRDVPGNAVFRDFSLMLDMDKCIYARVINTLRNGLFWFIAQRVEVIPDRRFGTTYPFHLKGPRIQKEIREP
jgi:hypothetical protein